jgi:glycerophosphoryl diester phosphodiesterase
VIRATLASLRRRFFALAAADVLAKALVVALAAPLTSLAFRAFVERTGRDVLADVDILHFALSPLGLASFGLVGVVAAGAWFWELLTQLQILWADESRLPIDAGAAVRASLSHVGAALRLGGRILGGAAIRLAPYAVAAAALYQRLLTAHDINYYLANRPPTFYIAVAAGGMLATLATWHVGSFLAARALSLPLLLTEDLSPAAALRASCTATAGRRWSIAAWLAGAAAAAWIASAALTTGFLWCCGQATRWISSLEALALAVGVLLVAHFALQLAASVLGNAFLSATLWQLYATAPHRAYARPTSASRLAGGLRRLAAWSRRRWLVTGLAAALLAALVGAVSFAGLETTDRAVVTAHRGGAFAAPENTLAAIEGAISAEADWVEIDVQETADGEVVVIHDSDLLRVGGSPLKVWETPWAALRAIDVGSYHGAQFADQRIPTLDETLQACRGRVGVNIELKYYGHSQRLPAAVVEIVERNGMADQIVVMSLERALVAEVKQLRPDWQVGLLTAVAASDLTRVAADFLAVQHKLATPEFVERAHRRGKRVAAWTINDRSAAVRMISRGVDDLITDDPAMVRAVLRERSELSLAERWLVGLASSLR